MTIHITECAAKQIRLQLAKRGAGLGLRVGIKKVGCSGYAYTFDYADKVNGEDRTFAAHDAKLIVDASALEVLDGAVLDFVKDGLKQMFRLNNPNIDATCGCGESFSLKTPPPTIC